MNNRLSSSWMMGEGWHSQRLGFLILVCLFALPGRLFADAQLMVSPTRVLFEEKSRNAEITLINSGDRTGTYRISFVRKMMTEEGAYVDLAGDEDGLFADPYIRFSPRQVTIPPGKAQTVRLMLRKPADLADGEYRSHMLFQSIPDASATNIEEQIQDGKKGVSVRLIPILGISIPVIFRQGKLQATTTMSQLAFQPSAEQSAPELSMVFERSGSQSVYGDVIVKYLPRGGRQEYVVGMAKGISVFTPNAKRKVTIRLQPPAGVAFGDGVLAVDYRQPESEGGKLLASSQITITSH